MSTVAVVVVVVGACIGVVTSVLTRTLEPATKDAPPERARAEPAHARSYKRVEAVERVEPPEAVEAVEVVEAAAPVEAIELVAPRRVVRAGGQPVEPIRWWERARSAMALTAVSISLGVLAAAVIGVAMVALFSLLRGAVG